MDFNNIVIQAYLIAILGIVVACGYFYIKLGLFMFDSKPKKKAQPKAAADAQKK